MESNLTIGRLLKQTREKKNISLEDVANKTKININILRSLEKDDLEALPNKTYVKGFVKNYAKTLHLDMERAMESFELSYQEKEPEAPEEELREVVHPKERELEVEELQDRLKGIFGTFFHKKTLIAFGVLAGIFLVGKGGLSFFSSLNSEKNKLQDEAAQDVIKPKDSSLFEMESAKKIAAQSSSIEESEDVSEETTTVKESEALEEPNTTEAESGEIASEEEKEPVEEQEKKEEVSELPPGKLPYKNFYPAPRNLFTLAPDAPETKNEEMLPPKFREAADLQKHNVFINAREGDTWLSYQIDGEDVKRFVLKKGRHLFLQGEEVVLLFMGNFNAAKVFYNNQLVKAQTSTGVKSFIFPEIKSAEFDFPLFPSHKGIPYRQEIYKKRMAEKPAS